VETDPEGARRCLRELAMHLVQRRVPRPGAGGPAMKQLLAWTGSADSTITSAAVMAMAEKFNTGQEVCLQIPSARGVMQVRCLTVECRESGTRPLAMLSQKIGIDGRSLFNNQRT
jgi:hypothetical protein